MKVALAVILMLHGVIHLMGFAKAFGYAELEALKVPISKPMGALWLVAGALAVLAAGLLFTSERWWWLAMAASVVLSQAVIIGSWSDAKFGTVPNALVLVAAVVGFFNFGPFSLKADYERRVERGLARTEPQPLVTEADLAPLPAPVARYLRLSGVVGKPRVQNFHAHWGGRIRSSAESPWMPLDAEQYNFADEPSRLFFMKALRGGVPAVGLHAYDRGAASMKVKVASMVPVVDAEGPQFTRTETVTLFNDMCLLAPATLLSPQIAWEPVSDTEVRARFTNAGQTVAATLFFDGKTGDLIDFWSDDRPALAPDNSHFVPMRWSTPIKSWKTVDGVRIAGTADIKYHAPTGTYAYGEFELKDIAYNVDH